MLPKMLLKVVWPHGTGQILKAMVFYDGGLYRVHCQKLAVAHGLHRKYQWVSDGFVNFKTYEQAKTYCTPHRITDYDRAWLAVKRGRFKP